MQKHSEADNVKLSLLLERQKMLLSIEDDGRGFNISDKSDMTGKAFGLSIMRERAEEIGAALTVEFDPGKGCRVALTLPVLQGGKNIHETHACG